MPSSVRVELSFVSDPLFDLERVDLTREFESFSAEVTTLRLLELFYNPRFDSADCSGLDEFIFEPTTNVMIATSAQIR